MTALENFFSNDQNNDWRNDEQEYNVDTDNDGIGENSEQTPLAKAVSEDQNYQTITNSDDDFGPGDEEDDDDDLLEDDSDLIEEDEDLPLDDDEISDEDPVGVDLDEEDEDEDFDDTDTSINQSTSFDADFQPSNHGRTTGTMTDHEPGSIGGL